MQLAGDELEVISRCLGIEARRQADLQALELTKRNTRFDVANAHDRERTRLLKLKEKIDAAVPSKPSALTR